MSRYSDDDIRNMKKITIGRTRRVGHIISLPKG